MKSWPKPKRAPVQHGLAVLHDRQSGRWVVAICQEREGRASALFTMPPGAALRYAAGVLRRAVVAWFRNLRGVKS